MNQSRRVEKLSSYVTKATRGAPVRMHMNENPSLQQKGLNLTRRSIARYPEEEPLAKAIAEAWRIPAESLMFFNGASEAIMCAALALVNPDDNVVTSRPEFALIHHYLTLAGAKLLEVPLQNHRFQEGMMESALETGCAMLFTSVPHNPSGAVLESGTVLRWCRTFTSTLIVIDEAYSSFANCSLTEDAARTANLIVIRSFSKDYGMAGLRLGAAVGPPKAIEAMGKVRTPFSINAAALKAGQRALKSPPDTEGVKREVRKLAEATERAGLRTVTGCGNFFLIEGAGARMFAALCLEANVLLRPLPDGTVRVSPSNGRGNDRYLHCLEEWRRNSP